MANAGMMYPMNMNPMMFPPPNEAWMNPQAFQQQQQQNMYQPAPAPAAD